MKILILSLMMLCGSVDRYHSQLEPTKVYLIELNHMYDGKGQYIESQIIHWTLQDEYPPSIPVKEDGCIVYRVDSNPIRRQRVAFITSKVKRDHKVHRFRDGSYRTFVQSYDYGYGRRTQELKSESWIETHTSFDSSRYPVTLFWYKNGNRKTESAREAR